MTTFSTTGPIVASIDVSAGDVVIAADAEAGGTEVDITPADPTRERDRRAAAEARVTYADGRLSIVARKRGSVTVVVRLAPGSDLEVACDAGRVSVDGRVGSCRVQVSAGDIRVGEADAADLRTSAGTVLARHVHGDVYCSTGSGAVEFGHIGGAVEVRNSNGATRIGAVAGPLRVKSSNGDITVERSQADVSLNTSNGALRIGSAEGRSVRLQTSLGSIEVGVPEGTAALLDLSTSFGSVRSDLEATSEPSPEQPTLEVHARTSAGDIVISRATG